MSESPFRSVPGNSVLLAKADPAWEAFARREPYFAVLTASKFLRANLTDQARQEFFASGETLVDAAFRTIELRLAPHFAPTAILEYGCGAGRLALPLARRAGRRGGTVMAVDRSAALLEIARDAAHEARVANIEFCTPDVLFGGDRSFDFVACYLVLQRIDPVAGLDLLRALIQRIAPGGIGLFQFPYRSKASPLVRGSRWLREHVPGANGIANLLRGHPVQQPFIPSHVYDQNTVLALLDDHDLRATHVVFDDHDDLASVMLLVEAPMRRRESSGVAEAPPLEEANRERPVNVTDLIASTSIDDLNAAAENYFASLTDWDHHLAKPFSSADEAPWLLINLAVLLQALQLRAGFDVLEFGAGTGWLSRYVTQLGCRAILLDVSPTALRIARELYARVPVIGSQPAPEFLVFDGRRIALPDASVDRIVCFHAFHHTPNAPSILAEFGRILRPGGMAAFAEPGPQHSQAVQSQYEMRSFRVVENDVDVHQLWQTAQTCGFVDLRMMVFHGLPFLVSLAQYEDLLRGGATAGEWTAETRVFLRHVRNFVLTKAGGERIDSRVASALGCEIHAQLVGHPTAGAPIAVDLIVTNTGRALWLPPSAGHGGVSLGMHVYEASVLVATEILSAPLVDPVREIASGETMRLRVNLPARPAGRYVIEIDCVADRVSWFAQTGSRPARILAEVR